MPVLTVGKKQILYIHVPKTGGTSVEHLLRSYGGSVTLHTTQRLTLPCTPQHFHGELLKQVLGSTSNAESREHNFDFVFMTVRHPILRLLSEYRHQRTMYRMRATVSPNSRRPKLRDGAITQWLSMDLWCRYALLRYSRDPFFSDNHLRPQVEFSIWNPVVYRLEDGLESIRARLDEILGIRGELPTEPQKVSNDRNGDPQSLKSSTRRLIQAHFARDFAEYGYQLDGSLDSRCWW
ncbi:sulfotransferase family 2 domain-containing protein [Mycolicibacterium holsaticum]|uniref:sulfotransferase family 2 domain-containing protein n=1 Tax=Mycolicibacterium holsaticum TaxID=152142 RepID=UPI001C7D2A44|nr:sulfotransferase family protein [Mycolicibacterium holsaticum DSM 44478 = JCM 12374]UNC10715.1 sulfotransferase family 2 domain-containing protein [Mycolicibacterium holsaticum DSM 44478 = JCM 12374]